MIFALITFILNKNNAYLTIKKSNTIFKKSGKKVVILICIKKAVILNKQT